MSLLRFDHELLLHGTADMTAIDALARRRSSIPVWRDELLARRLCLDALTRGPRAVIDAVEPLAGDERCCRAPACTTLLGGCLTRTGRMDQALAFLVPPSGATVRQGSTVLSEPWSPFGDHALTLIGLGRLGEAEELLAAAQEELTAHEGSQESAIVAASLAALRLEQGRVQTAFLQATSAAAVFLDLSLPVSARWCEALSAHALALAGVGAQGHPDAGRARCLGTCRPTCSTRSRCSRPRAWAWAAGGDMGTARKTSRGGGRSGARRREICSGPRGRCTGLARMGRARQVRRRHGALASKVDGELTAARLSYDNGRRRQGQSRRSPRPPRGSRSWVRSSTQPKPSGESAVHLRRDGCEPGRRGDAAGGRPASRPL